MAIEEALGRLAAAGIDLLTLTGVDTHFALHRDGFVVLVERTADGFGAIGSTGLLTGHGFAALVSRATGPVFVARGHEQPASERDVERLRQFASDVENALR